MKARLANRPDEDICLLIQAQEAKLNYLCDCGVASQMTIKERRDVGAIFISHTHVDHFAGFDEIMRHQLGVGRAVILCGPPGLAENASCKMRAFTWNLGYDDQALSYEVRELHPDGRVQLFSLCVPDWRPQPQGEIADAGGVAYQDKAVTVRYALLSHGNIPSVAYLFEAPTRTKIKPSLPHRPGPWVRGLIEAYEAADPGRALEVDGAMMPAGALFEHVYAQPGQRIGFVMDHLGDEANHARIEALCGGADQLFIEAYYREEDQEMALKNHHSTARRSGEVARRAGVKAVIPCHFSRRYQEDLQGVIEECQAAFKGD
ncbi:hypothetical protein KKF91_11435 [Myxococcota bacterium]|nr:hypothetical protein [Myxococcota bacterium]MBU1431140.1 hypothetical protein [Myxococcota bacterium]